MVNRVTRTVLFAASALLSISAFGAGAARFGTLRNSDWVVTNAWQAVSNKTHDLILEIGQGDSLPPDWQNVSNAAMNAVQSLQPSYDYTDNALISFSSTGSVFRSLSYGTATRWTDATGCVWEVSFGAWSVTHSPPLRENDFFDGPEWFNDDSIAGDYFVGPGWYIWSSSLTYERISDDLNFNSYTCEWDGDGVNYVTVCIRPALTNFVGRVALTNDISQAISTNNSAFVSAVLAAPIVGADPNDLSEIAEYGSYGTVGAALLALIAGLAALKRRMTSAETAISAKADASDLPYALVTPGEWSFSGTGYNPSKTYRVRFSDGSETSYAFIEIYDPVNDNWEMIASPLTDVSSTVLSLSWDDGRITATRASLPGHLLDRANNLVNVTANTTLTLPPFVAGKVRDLLVACTIGLDGNDEPWSVIFQGADSESISFKAEGDDAASATFPVPDAAGDWWYSLTERAPHVFAVSLKQLQSVSQPTQTQGGS